jgi:hypothetical protein
MDDPKYARANVSSPRLEAPLRTPEADAIDFRFRREMALAVVPLAIALTATANLCWAAMVAPEWLPGWWFEASLALLIAAGVSLVVACFIGRFRRGGRGIVGVLGFSFVACIMTAPVFESSVLNLRGVEVECTVVSSAPKEFRGDTLIEHVLDCPGQTGITWSTEESDQWAVGERVVGYFDPEGHAHYSFGDRDWTETVLWAIGSLVVALIAVIWRLLAVDDGSLQARFTGQPLEPDRSEP